MNRNRTSARSELAEHRASWAGKQQQQQQQQVEAAPMQVDGHGRWARQRAIVDFGVAWIGANR